MSVSSQRRGRDPWPLALAVVLGPLGLYFLAQHALPRLAMTEAGYGAYYWDRRFWLLAHTAGGLLATLLGPWQFVRGLRARRPGLHRAIGLTYLAAVTTAATAAYVLAATSQISESYKWGLVAGASLWLATAAAAYLAIRRRNVARHRAWMVRNYTVTFFFITFFALLDLFQAMGWTDVPAYAGPLVIACLILPLAGVEAVLRVRRLAG